MSDTMRAAVVPELGQPLEIQELAIPIPGPFEALVKVEYSGVCHTDLHAANGDWPVKPTAPFIPGHEGVGTVVAVGDRVERVAVGDKVGNAWLATACGACEYCEEGWETLCPHQKNSGYSVNGSFGQYMLVDSRYCPVVPDGVDAAAAARLVTMRPTRPAAGADGPARMAEHREADPARAVVRDRAGDADLDQLLCAFTVAHHIFCETLHYRRYCLQ